jgi:hypothetical protein
LSIDVQGVEVVKPYVEAAGNTHPVLVDRANVTGGLFGVKIVPYALALNPDGTVAAGPFRADIDDPEFYQNCVDFAKGEKIPKAWNETIGSPLSAREREALQYLHEGQRALENGDRERALTLLKNGFELDPKNWTIRKQIWALENPQKFYESDKPDFKWQKEQIEREDSSADDLTVRR